MKFLRAYFISAIIALLLSLFIQTPANATFSYQNNFGTSGNGYQYSVVDKACQVWVCSNDDANIRIMHPKGTESPFSPLLQGKNSSGTTISLSHPAGVAMDSTGTIYVSVDNGTTGYICKFQFWNGTALNGINLTYRPGDIAIDSTQRIFVTEKVTTGVCARFHVYNLDGSELTGSPVVVSGTGTFINRGIGVRQDATAVYIASETDGVIRKFTGSLSGNVASYTQAVDFLSSLAFPVACEVDNINRVYVSTTTDNSVRIYNADGSLRDTLIGSGLTKPFGVSFFPNSQVLFVSQYVSSGVIQRWTEPVDQQIPILGYHNVTASCNFDHSLYISPDNLADVLSFITRHGYHMISLDSIYNYWLQGTPLPSNPVAMTFDDNYSGELWFGGALLTARNMPGTIFVTSYYCGVTTGTGPHASWAELGAVDTCGLVRTESHTVNHTNLTTVDPTSAYNECYGSKTAIQNNIPGKICKFIAYPNGGDTNCSSGNTPVPALAARAGYRLSFSYAGGFCDRTSPQHNMPRVIMSGGDTLNQFKVKLGYTGSRIASDPYIVNDDGNGDGTFTTTGTWSSGATLTNGNSGCYGTSFAYIAAGTGTKTATFTPNLSTASNYDVYIWWDSDTNRATNAPVTINSSTGANTIRVNESTGGFCWYPLGRYYFNAGTGGSIVVSDNANGVVVADAVKLEPVITSTFVENFNLYQ